MKMKEDSDKLRILVTGATGFIGSRLVKRLLASHDYKVVCMSRNPSEVDELFQTTGEILEVVKANALNYSELVQALKGVDIAYYLIHSMEGSSKDWKKFAERDRIAAENFAKAASENHVKRIIYLSGLTFPKEENLSEHMRSRREVGEILKKSTAKVTIFRAAVILGQGGGSFQMLQHLVERLPVMICPKWISTKSQPIYVDDVVTYLIKAVEVPETIGREFDIGGPEILSYYEMMKRYAKILNKSLKIVIIPVLTPRLSSYWIDLITPIKASLARPLIDSLKHEAVVYDNSIQKIVPIELKGFEDSISSAIKEGKRIKKVIKKQKTSESINKKILIISLIALAVVGATYYFIDDRNDVYEPIWLVLSGLWYFGIAVSLFFVKNGARLGSMIAGILGWMTLAFWLVDNIYLIDKDSAIVSEAPNIVMTIRNFVGAVVASLVIASSHNLFHKIRLLSI